MKTIVIIGFMAAGKTTVGRKIAKELSLQFFDVDEAVESNSGKTIEEIFAESGEKYFRQLESHSFAELISLHRRDTIIAAGGGLILNEANQKMLTDQILIFLDTDFAEIENRIRHDLSNRPIAKGLSSNEIKKLYEERRKSYIVQAHHLVKNADEMQNLLYKLKQMES